MIRTRRAALAQSAYRFSLATNAKAFARRSCSNKRIERDDDSKKSHPAPVDWLLSRKGVSPDDCFSVLAFDWLTHRLSNFADGNECEHRKDGKSYHHRATS